MKTIQETIASHLYSIPLEDRVKEPLYLKLISATVSARMGVVSKHLPDHHNLTSRTGHFGQTLQQEQYAS